MLIVDWDAHFGDGTYELVRDDPNILFVSLHRYDDGEYYPGTGHAALEGTGRKPISVPWPASVAAGDAEYLHAFLELILPAAFRFAPELVLISAGFDSALGDPKGGLSVTPPMFAQMTAMLSLVANQGRVIMALEGGYSPPLVAACVDACVRVLLGDAPPSLPALTTQRVHPDAKALIEELKQMHL